MKANRKEHWAYLLILFGCYLSIACDKNRVFEEYQGMNELKWAISDTVSFELVPTTSDTVMSSIGVKYNDRFAFHNLYVRYLLKDSLGNHLQDSLINIFLFDPKTGKPLGDGYGNVFTLFDTLPLLHLQQNQGLKVQLIQYMRKEQLEGIEAVGLKIIRR